MNANEFYECIDLLEKNMGRKASKWDIETLKSTKQYEKEFLEKAISYILFNVNKHDFYSPREVIDFMALYIKKEIDLIENKGSVMLKKELFDKQIKDFQDEFNLDYGFKRETLLYSAVSYMTAIEFNKALIELLITHNKDSLPTIREVTSMAYRVCPEAIREGQLNPCELKLA